ncbi:hypothetical protein UR09_00110 [Candidatus Nitromaritima sp. SCGC AAA799-A02]|nr:hypothetical protein UZ36_00110 [Candidatus Nitromaritima sp. SCGC AAA799-C22]KMP12732.1 hypothetical protein UR09_00110 [Candidatus Nitromaritima sp. SCGC AAA799-A02]
MGRDISKEEFSDADFREFRQRLREESLLLMEWFKQDAFEPCEEMCGFELEMWLVDREYLPAANNEEFLSRVGSRLVVPELSKFNFEINSTPHPLKGPLLSTLEKELARLVGHCEHHAMEMDERVLSVGILPTLKDDMLTLDRMSSNKRYAALNRQVLRLRGGRPIQIEIEGNDTLSVEHHDVMVEAATTSLQIHIQVDPSRAVRYYNVSQVLSAPMVAVAANSPYLFEKDLWDETRIPTFEQSVAVASFRDCHGEMVERVTFGTGYARESMMELFLENLHGYPILLPLVFDEDLSWLSHLRLHNGTVWRWNRPLIGLDSNGKPHLRIEHRVAAAGPSTVDTIANIAFYLGLSAYFVRGENPLERLIEFTDARENFYRAAKDGMNAQIKWADEREHRLRDLLSETLLPAARAGLLDAGVSPKEVAYYLDEVLARRIETGITGAAWQRGFIRKYGPEFQEMTQAYHENQRQNIPICEWKI